MKKEPLAILGLRGDEISGHELSLMSEICSKWKTHLSLIFHATKMFSHLIAGAASTAKFCEYLIFDQPQWKMECVAHLL